MLWTKGGGDLATPNVCVYGAWGIGVGTTVLGIPSGYATTLFWGTHGVHNIIPWDAPDTQEHLLGIRTAIKTDPDVQYTGTSTSRQKEHVGCRPGGGGKEWQCNNIPGGGGGISAPI